MHSSIMGAEPKFKRASIFVRYFGIARFECSALNVLALLWSFYDEARKVAATAPQFDEFYERTEIAENER